MKDITLYFENIISDPQISDELNRKSDKNLSVNNTVWILALKMAQKVCLVGAVGSREP